MISHTKIKLTKPRCVFFDLDNTLYDYSKPHLLAEQSVKDKLVNKLSITSDEFDRNLIKAKKDIKSNLKNTASSHSRLLYFHRLLELLNLNTQIILALDLEITYWRGFLDNAILFDGVEDFLDELRINEIPRVLITDLTADIQFKKIIHFRLESYFDYIVTSEETGLDKPAKINFMKAADKVDIYDDIWMIGDDHEKDIIGARESLNAITFQRVNQQLDLSANNLPDFSFTSFVQLQESIKTVLE